MYLKDLFKSVSFSSRLDIHAMRISTLVKHGMRLKCKINCSSTCTFTFKAEFGKLLQIRDLREKKQGYSVNIEEIQKNYGKSDEI